MRIHFLLTMLFCLTLPGVNKAYADCALAATAVCDGLACPGKSFKAGQSIYNSDHGVLQACLADGTWKALHKPVAPVGPLGCPNTGDVCTGAHAGMINAGAFNGNTLYVVASDSTDQLSWGAYGFLVMGGCYAAEPACSNGRDNTQLLNDHAQSFPAAEYCADLVAHDYDDWYLPSRDELTTIFDNLKAGQPAGTHNFKNGYYWSSSENHTNHSFRRSFNSGAEDVSIKNNPWNVRCARY